MPISLQCPNCGASYQLKDEMAGKRVKCRCGSAIQVPAAQQPNVNPGGGGLTPLGMGGDPLGAPQHQQWGAPQQQAPMQHQQPQLQPASSWGTPGGVKAKAGGGTNAITVLEVVASSLCIVQGGILGILHLIDFFDAVGSMGRAGGWAIVFTLLALIAGITCLCMLAFTICHLIDAIMRLAGSRSKMPWSLTAGFACCCTYVGLHVLGMLLLLILLLTLGGDTGKSVELFFIGGGGARVMNFWTFMYAILTSLVPVFYIVVFALKKKRR